MENSKKPFNKHEAIIPGIALLFAIAYFVQTSDAAWAVIKWPIALAIVTGIFWLSIVAVYVFSKSTANEEKKPPSKKFKPFVILVAPLVYVAIMPYIGFALSSLLFLSILFRCLDGKSWVRNIIIASMITTFLYVAMIVLMKMALPRLEIGSFIL